MPNLTISKPSPKVMTDDLPQSRAVQMPMTQGGGDLLDWEAVIETPPMRPSGVIRVRLEYAGRATPIPIDDPDTE